MNDDLMTVVMSVTSEERRILLSLLSTIRAGRGPVVFAMSDLSQLKAIYGEDADTINENANIRLNLSAQ